MEQFFEKEIKLKDVMMILLEYLQAIDSITVRYIHYDNAGENEAFHCLYKQEGMVAKFKYIMPGTLQQNGQVGRKIATIFNQVCPMLNGGKFSPFLRNSLQAKAANNTMLYATRK